MYILFILGIIGIIINFFIVTNTTDGGIKGPATTSVWGYGTMAMSVLGLMFNIIGKQHLTNSQTSTSAFSLKLLTNSLPAILLLIVLVSILSLNAHYYNRINSGNIPEDYSKYRSLSNVTISIQYLLLAYYISSGSIVKQNHEFDKIFAYINYLFAVCNIILIIMLTIIVKYFSTDG
jgi:hypothetical protein